MEELELFIREKDMPKKCFDCFCFDREYTECTASSIAEVSCKEGVSPKNCPLKSIEEHDKETKKRILDYIFDEADAQDLGEFNGWGWVFSEEDVQRIKNIFKMKE